MTGLHLGLGLGLSNAGVAAPIMLPYTLLHDFEALGGTTSTFSTIAQHTGSRKILNTAGLNLKGIGTGSGPAILNVVSSTLDFANFERVAFCIDVGDGLLSELATLRPTFTVGATTYSLAVDTGVSAWNDSGPPTRGKTWTSQSLADLRATAIWANASIKTVGTSSKALRFSSFTSTGSYAPDVVLDAAILLPTGYKPSIMLTFDDGHDTHYTEMFADLAVRGLVATCYVPWNLTNTAGRMTTAQMLEMQAGGWAMCTDSDADSSPVTKYATVAEAIAALNANIASMSAAGVGTTASRKHLCYSFGSTGINTTGPISGTSCVTTNTSSTVTRASGTWALQISPGMTVSGTGIPAGTTILSMPTSTSMVLSQNATASGTVTLTFVGVVLGLTVTANGTTAVTLNSTTNLVAGMEMRGYTVPANTTIVSVDSGTTITTSAAIPATCVRGSFALTASEWWPTKLADSLIAEGFLSGRTTTTAAPYPFSGYGLDSKATIFSPGSSFEEGVNTTNLIKQLQALVRAGRDVILYNHSGDAQSAHHIAFYDAVEALVDGGEANCVTVPAWWAAAAARLPIA